MNNLLKFISTTTLALVSGVALAHSGHGDTLVHAVLHMIETNGLAILVLFVALVASLLLRYKKQSKQSQALQKLPLVKQEEASDNVHVTSLSSQNTDFKGPRP